MTLLIVGVITLIFGDWRDALFLGILVLNAGIGIVQEWRAKVSLDRLAALVAPTATVVRDGQALTVPVDEVLEGDLVRIGAGDQVVGDGRLLRADGLGVDESILTGESEPVQRDAGDGVRAGSFAVEGSGEYVAEAVGADTYAERLVGEAREFRHPRSPLETALDRLILVLGVSMVPLGALLGWSLIEQDVPFREAVGTAVAGVITLVPEGLVLLTGLTFAVATLRMTRRGALAQQLNAVESLASVDVICLDKTGTLTEESLRVVGVTPAEGVAEEELRDVLGRFAAASPGGTGTLDAIAAYAPADEPPAAESVPFSSARRWSGVRLGGRTVVMGAPEHFDLGGALGATARAEAAAGRRVLALARGDAPLVLAGKEAPPPPGLRPLGIVTLSEQLRQDARETVAFLLDDGIELRVISGDAPPTVAAIAADAGIPVQGDPVDGRELPEGEAELRALARERTVVGRISPDGKRRFVEALAAEGKHVVMVGDGVNDVPALKAARLAIAQGSGSQMARGIADLVLVRNGFASVPPMIREGRKVMRNLQRVAKLFVTKSMLAAFLVLTVGLSSESYPFLPRHLTLASAITIGIPAFVLALAPSAGPWRPTAFLRELARFAIPAGTAMGLGVVASFLLALNLVETGELRARTVATTVLVAVGLYLIVVLESSSRVRGWTVAGLCAALFALYLVVLELPAWRGFFEVSGLDAAVVICSLLGAGLAIGGLVLMDERFLPGPIPAWLHPSRLAGRRAARRR
ncbi:HAD-IC family P-type ATPase [Miltoncostaea marina]|uniref:HAD-IC family P-type ATPase n=1 Tax=Miltoncostaea marina TaxID=2843215 RepID=UPI001C3DBB35|nr:HAD-IC family P-type ATPase [Miltoncostaea marina]